MQQRALNKLGIGRRWASDKWGAAILRTPKWLVFVGASQLKISSGDKVVEIPFQHLRPAKRTKGLIWSEFEINTIWDQNVTLPAIRNHPAADMEACINSRILHFWEKAFGKACASIEIWAREIDHALNADRWITAEDVEQLSSRRPADQELGMDLAAYLQTQAGQKKVTKLTRVQKQAVALWRNKLRGHIASRNQQWLDGELKRHRDFFNKVEKSPLTEQQARAVACFDNRVLVVAAAGSGKTSTMVARAGYALQRKIIPPEEILLLAFNKDAATELQQRVRDRLTPLGLPAEQVIARTFHSFGLGVIGLATGKKPRLAAWVDSGKDIQAMSDLIDHLRDSNRAFRVRWGLFRFVFDEDLAGFEDIDVPEDWDPRAGESGFRTIRGEIVKSREERILANWYFFNGIDYRYEASYEHDVADSEHSQYQPDFYLPAVNVYHEHFALDETGQPPPHFENYLSGVSWKERTHQEYGTALLTTTSASLRSGEAFEYLAQNLESLGVQLDPDPDRDFPDEKLIDHKHLASLFRTFLTHAKGSRLSADQLRQRLNQVPATAFSFRHRLFLDLYESLSNAWNKKLADGGEVDFEDMLNMAADHIEDGRYQPPFRLVMVDEFQDASQARARLTKALVNRPGRYLFAVGDDWQSINRFAGADISVMTHFHNTFGTGPTHKLSQTFRCPQALCDISSTFISKNTNQIEKQVTSNQQEYPPTIRVIIVPDRRSHESAIQEALQRLVAELSNVTHQRDLSRKQSVLLLGRYRANRPKRLGSWLRQFQHILEINFLTVHGSKGLEADYVFLLGVTRRGFPCMKEDDPILSLAMPHVDGFRLSEERRLFYVALTRARRNVTIFTEEGRASEFLVELKRENSITVEHAEDCLDRLTPCPRCKRGTMLLKNGRRGSFYGCSTFPACRETWDYPAEGKTH